MTVRLTVLSRGRSALAARVRALSDRLVRARRPLRVLQSIGWDATVADEFFARRCRALPPVGCDYYKQRPLSFDPAAKIREFDVLAQDIVNQLGADRAASALLVDRCRESSLVARLLAARGTPAFAKLSRELYGSASIRLRGEPDWIAAARQVSAAGKGHDAAADKPTISADEAARLLASRLQNCFPGQIPPRIRVVEELSADAAAGGTYVKLRRDARFTARQIRLLEVHEGWIHFRTTVNGRTQPHCTFFGTAWPSAALTQEGLAIAAEALAGVCDAARVRKVCLRFLAVAMAEEGADFLDVFRFFLDAGSTERESYQHAARIFRGSLPDGCGPFTKDACYFKGFIVLLRHFERALRAPRPWSVPLLFSGKTALSELGLLEELAAEGLLARPRQVPPLFADPARLALAFVHWRRVTPAALGHALSAIMHEANQTPTADVRSAA
jgi:uncharacterized protein (TIGR02421 family)